MQTCVGLTEPFDLEDILVDGLGYVERMAGGNMRFVFYVTKHGERISRLAMVMHQLQVPEAMDITKDAVESRGMIVLPIVPELVN